MSEFFIKRGEKVQGPLNLTTVKRLADAGKLRESDLIARSKSGVFTEITHYFKLSQNQGEASSKSKTNSSESDPAVSNQNDLTANQLPTPDSREATDQSASKSDATKPASTLKQVNADAYKAKASSPPPIPSLTRTHEQNIQQTQVTHRPTTPAIHKADRQLNKAASSSTPPIPTSSRSNNHKLIVVGGISGGVLLLLIVFIFIIAMKSGDEVAKVDKQGGPSSEANESQPNDQAASNQDNNQAESNKSVKADDASKPEDYSYVVPDKIEKLPPMTFVPSQREFVKELLAVGFRRKGEFEKNDSYFGEMKTLWESATIFGQPSTNRFLLLAAFSNWNYDTESETLTFNFSNAFDHWDKTENGHPPSGLSQLADVTVENPRFSESRCSVSWWNCPNKWQGSFRCEFKLDPALAEEILGATLNRGGRVLKPVRSGLQVAWVISLGLVPDSRHGLPLEAGENVISDQTVHYSYGLYPTFLHEVIVFRHDTGEILHRTGHTDND